MVNSVYLLLLIPAFAVGFLVAVYLFTPVWVSYFKNRAITGENQNSTPVYFYDKFYYIIEESHFVKNYVKRIDPVLSPEEVCDG